MSQVAGFSCRQFQNTPIPDEVMQDMLEAARLSPSGRNEQPWRFGVITDPALAERFDALEQDVYRALNQEEHQTKIAGTHIALAALEHGAGSCWVSRFEVMKVAELLRLPENCLPSEILVCGYAEKPRQTVSKKALQALVFDNSFPLSSEIPMSDPA